MTAPGGEIPDGSLGVGLFRTLQLKTVDDAKETMSGGVVGSFTLAQEKVDEELRQPMLVIEGHADAAVTTAEAAANDSAAAVSTAAAASARASYWEAEFVVSSAAVVLGVNELLLGLCQNVPGGLTRTITDMHVALLTQPAGMTFQLKKWNATGTTASVLDTYTLAANVTRANWANLGFAMNSRERVFPNVTSVTGSVAPVVFQVLLFGVMQ